MKMKKTENQKTAEKINEKLLLWKYPQNDKYLDRLKKQWLKLLKSGIKEGHPCQPYRNKKAIFGNIIKSVCQQMI